LTATTLPEWAKSLRPLQVTAIEETSNAFQSGNDIVVLEAPTGTGKTLIADQIRQTVSPRALYLCSSLPLQDQFAKDFPEATILRGRSNYPTADYPERFNTKFDALSAGDCVKTKECLPACGNCNTSTDEPTSHCLWCHPVRACPYENAKMAAIRNNLVCSNTYYFLYEANYSGALSNRGLVIVDECDTLEKVLMSFVEFHITERTATKYGITPPAKKTVSGAWIEWATLSQKEIATRHQHAKHNAQGSNDVKKWREVSSLERILGGLERLNNPDNGLPAGGWVYTGYGQGDIKFKPIEVGPYAEEYLWRHGKKWLLMSATVISTDVMMKSLGVSR
jgi:Rad3-related DNA helicase